MKCAFVLVALTFCAVCPICSDAWLFLPPLSDIIDAGHDLHDVLTGQEEARRREEEEAAAAAAAAIAKAIEVTKTQPGTVGSTL